MALTMIPSEVISGYAAVRSIEETMDMKFRFHAVSILLRKHRALFEILVEHWSRQKAA